MNLSFIKKAFVAGTALLVLTLPSLAQDDQKITIYKGGANNDAPELGTDFRGLKVGGWGAGTCAQGETSGYGDAGVSLKVTTGGYYEGARFDFNPPIDLTTCFQTPDTYLRFAVKFASSGNVSSTYTYMNPGMPGMEPPGMEMPGYTETPGAPMQPLLRNIRVVFYLANGEVLATTPQIVDISKPSIKGWAWMSLPFAAFKNAKAGAGIPNRVAVSRMVLTGNTRDTFYIGEIRTEVDNEPISDVSAGDDQVVAAYDVVVFQGSGSSKVSPLKYSWDFDDKDGIQEEATGLVAAHRYTTPGTYKATLTVSDPMGIKKPVSATCLIQVND